MCFREKNLIIRVRVDVNIWVLMWKICLRIWNGRRYNECSVEMGLCMCVDVGFIGKCIIL